MFFSSFFKQPVEVLCCTIFDKSFFVSLVLFCSVEQPKRPGSWKDGGNAHNQYGVESLSDVVWVDSYKLRAATSPGFLSVSLVSQWKFCTSGKEGIGLWICRSACAGTVALPDAASAKVHAHGCSVRVQCIQSSAWAGKNSTEVSCSAIWAFGNFPFLGMVYCYHIRI